MADITQDQEFLDYIIKLIVTNPDEIEITRTIDDLGVLITLKVAKEDMGRIIGKDGQTAKAIRTLLRAIGSRNEERINMKILEPEEEAGAAPAPAPESSEVAAEPAAEEAPAADAELVEGSEELPVADLEPAEATKEKPDEGMPSADEL